MTEEFPSPRGGLQTDWHHWALVYQKRLAKLKRLICAKGYTIRSDETWMPAELIVATDDEQKTPAA